MTTSTATARLNSVTASGGTFTVPYPAGTSRADFSSLDSHVLYVNQSEYTNPTDFILAFNSSNITVTWRGGYSLPQRTAVRLGLTHTTRVEADDLLLSPTNPFAQVLSPLSSGDYSASVVILGDSTGNDNTDWPYRLFAEKIGPLMPNVRIVQRLWDDTAQDYGAETVIQAANGERKLVFVAADADYRYLPYDEPVARASADFDVRVKVSLDNWNTGSAMWIAGQMGAAGQRGWELGITTSGRLAFYWSPDGTAISANVQSTNPLGTAAGVQQWVRATLVAATGVATAYTSPDGVTWTQVGQSTVGATSIFASNATITLGNAGGNGYISGTIAAIEVRDGIAGPIRNVQPIESWFPRPTPLVTLTGSPTLYVFNGSQSGAGLTYLTDATRMPKMMVPGDAQVIILSTGLNDSGVRMTALYTAWSNWIDAIRLRSPTASIVAITQNPTHSTTNILARRNIPYSLPGICQRKNVTLIDTFRAFRRAIVDDGLALTDLMGDGVHPSPPFGVDVTLNEVWRVIAQRLT